ncbi:NADH dehydrogenase (ubiquinone) 30 kDa subunit [Thermincola ferriacetica]|uniref:NADH dehydrogenase (Ubiquinone) 30 kDa subunit n=2 Tax=Thermincola TaxID=278993 RepID=D5XDP6_THEPJ|nr:MULTISPECIES: NADH-quinone oxidoreductase subunit C [Thermincola]ADG83792.1 NADH dehydrogenase (ubiquinone) 30 kDa subunit [Thermincola potens JR]KNZ69743.1 NADH dehydrogenase (ubiquinone) 30 kDa subunit [Thermincola ferriacetica]
MASVQEIFSEKLRSFFGDAISLQWNTDNKGAVWGWCRLADHHKIDQVALIVAGLRGRVITITAYWTKKDTATDVLEIAYHFDLDGCTCTVTVSLPADDRSIKSITPILKSADWHEREMQELYPVKVLGHPNPQPLFLAEGTDIGETGMVPLSEAMQGATTRTLWEKVNLANAERRDKN